MRRALILGGADCVWDDIKALKQITRAPWTDLVIAANDIGSHWPGRLDHWVSLHSDKLLRWIDAREEAGYPQGYTTWSHRFPERVDRIIRPWGGGSSGLLAIAVAYEIKVDRAILCGMPMDSSGHFPQSGEHDGKPWPPKTVRSHWRAWDRERHRMDFVRSMSGRTRRVLGRPTAEWLNGTNT